MQAKPEPALAAMRLGEPVPADAMRSIERTLQLHHFKWDTQVGDTGVLLPQPLLMAQREWDWLCAKAERAAQEIYVLEQTIACDPTLQRVIGVPRPLRRLLVSCAPANGLRTLRFDFHPTTTGWLLSEVNTDVPGGFGEASALPALFEPFRGKSALTVRPLTEWGNAVERAVVRGHVALLHAPGYLEDQQVVLALSRELKLRGFTPHVVQSPEALQWRDGCACLSREKSVQIVLVVRFFQTEWLARLPNRSGWRELFKRQGNTVVSNPPECVISESKRLPLIFRSMPAASGTLQKLFPECRELWEVQESAREEWVLKAAYSNTGDAVQVGAELPQRAWERLLRSARRNSSGWIAQRRFETVPLASVQGPVRPCVGVFVIGDRAAGAYVRLSRTQVTDAHALEAPLFVLPDEDLK